MTSITSLLSEEKLKRNFARDIRERILDQKFLYMTEEGARGYYGYDDTQNSKDAYNYINYFPHTLIDKNKPVAFISLGCGNAFTEKSMLKELAKQGYSVTYFGVDTSRSMLDWAAEELKEIPIDSHFIEGDMLGYACKLEIKKITESFSQRLFAVYGATICNVNQTDFADSLYNLMRPSDLLWLDTRVRENNSMESELLFFNRYTEFLTSHRAEFYFRPLKEIGVSFDDGRLILRSGHESIVGALKFDFYFRFSEKVVVELENERVHFLPGEEIRLQTIRIYHAQTLIDFLQGHDLMLKECDLSDPVGQFIFQPIKTHSVHNSQQHELAAQT